MHFSPSDLHSAQIQYLPHSHCQKNIETEITNHKPELIERIITLPEFEVLLRMFFCTSQFGSLSHHVSSLAEVYLGSFVAGTGSGWCPYQRYEGMGALGLQLLWASAAQ